MQSKDINPFPLALKHILPIFLGSFPIAVVFGLFFRQEGLPWFFAPLFSLFVHGASIQFLALAMLIGGGSIFSIAIAMLPLALRNCFYGFSLIHRFKEAPLLLRLYLSHGLVDGVFSTLSTVPPLEGKKDLRFCIYFIGIIHLLWVLGTLFGTLLGTLLVLPESLKFSLTALFAVLAIEQYYKVKNFKPFLIAIGTFIISILLFPQYIFLCGVAALLIATILLPQKQEVRA